MAADLAEMGAYKDKWYYSKIACYKCDFIFDINDINRLSQRERVDFRTAGALQHARSHPSCQFLKDLPNEFRQHILGMF